jgi:hypothetical protein
MMAQMDLVWRSRLLIVDSCVSREAGCPVPTLIFQEITRRLPVQSSEL